MKWTVKYEREVKFSKVIEAFFDLSDMKPAAEIRINVHVLEEASFWSAVTVTAVTVNTNQHFLCPLQSKSISLERNPSFLEKLLLWNVCSGAGALSAECLFIRIQQKCWFPGLTGCITVEWCASLITSALLMIIYQKSYNVAAVSKSMYMVKNIGIFDFVHIAQPRLHERCGNSSMYTGPVRRRM